MLVGSDLWAVGCGLWGQPVNNMEGPVKTLKFNRE